MKTKENLSAVEYHEPERGQSNLGDLFGILIRHIPSIIIISVITTGLALAYLAVTKPTYTATTSVFIDPRSRKVVPEEVLQTNLGSDLALVESQVAIIGSDSVLHRVVAKMKLADDPEFAPDYTPGMLSRLKALIVPRGPIADKEQRAIASLSERLKVKRAQKTYVVDVEVSSSSPVKAAQLSSAVVDAYVEDQLATKSDEARRISNQIDARLDELRKQLRQAEIRVDDFKKANKILASEGGLVDEQQLTRLNRELVTAKAVEAESKARLDLVTSALASGGSTELLPDAMRSGLIQRLREQYAQVARRDAALSTQLQPRHPVLIEVRSQLKEIKQQIAAELKRIATSAKNEYQLTANRIAELSRTLQTSREEVSRTNTAQIRLRELEQEVNTSRDLLNTFLTRAKQTQEQQNLSITEARVISPASVPSRPSKPISWLVLALGLLGGAGFGVARALIIDHLDSSVKTGTDVAEQTGFATFATLPSLAPSGLGRFLPGRGTAETIGFSEIMSALADARSVRNGYAFRQAVLRLVSRVRTAANGTQPAITMVLAPRSGAGASATALSLAYAAALSGERVLLIDAASTDTELSNVLARDFDHRQLVVLDNKKHLQAITRRDARTGLAFLPIALADLRTLKTHQRKRLATGISALAQSFDHVFIDGGAILEDESADALLPIVDQLLIVARSGVTSPAAIDDAVKALEPARDRLLGIVLNRSGKPVV
ncbi:MAG: hypothetical protein KDJ47_17120 [Hyphomicrobiaceae bacterium]|nr:hypothetical protein [Hyphomicrobiaceae bacterium]